MVWVAVVGGNWGGLRGCKGRFWAVFWWINYVKYYVNYVNYVKYYIDYVKHVNLFCELTK